VCVCVCGLSLIYVCISFVLKDGGFVLVQNVTEEVQMLKNRVELLEQVRITHTHTHTLRTHPTSNDRKLARLPREVIGSKPC